MSSSKKRNRARDSMGTPSSGGRRSLNKNISLCSPTNESVWSHCEKCCVSFILDNMQHSCGEDLSWSDTCFIRNHRLLGAVCCGDSFGEHTVSRLHSTPSRTLPAQSPQAPWSSSCVLAPDTMRECRLYSGDWVLVEYASRESFNHLQSSFITARVWPCEDCPADSLILTGRLSMCPASGCDHSRSTSTAVPRHRLTCLSSLEACCVPASRLVLHVTPLVGETLSFSSSCRRFRQRLLYEFDGVVVAAGVKFQLTYLGCAVHVRVVSVETAESSPATRDFSSPSEDICQALSQLSVDSKCQSSPQLQFAVISASDTELQVTGNKASSLMNPNQSSDDRKRFTELFGADSVLAYLRRLIGHSDVQPSHCSTAMPAGVLVFALSGCGKTTLAGWIADRYTCHILSGSQLAATASADAHQLLDSAIRSASSRLPCVLFIDDIDAVSGDRRLVAQLAALLDSPAAGLVVIATATRPDDVDPILRRAGRLDRELELPPPNAATRCQILSQMLSGHSLCSSDVEQLSTAAHGYVGADLRAVICEALLASSGSSEDSCSAVLSLETLMAALRRVRPSAVRQLHVEVPSVRWSDVAGQHELKLRLRQTVEWPLKHADAFRRLGISAPRGLLMYGPPGCSKTMIARALATESGLNFIAIKGPELFNKWVGESERAVRSVFRRARQAAPCIIFIDELDALAVKRSEGGAGNSGGGSVGERVLAQLLTEMDGVASQRDEVIVVAATNRPDMLDAALLRPGRLDSLVHVPLPDRSTRIELFRLRLANIPVCGDVCCEWLADETPGYSGAEVVAVCHEAALRALQRNESARQILRADFEQALGTVQPRVTDYHCVYQEFHKKRAVNMV